MSTENYPAKVRVLTPDQLRARWRELGWGEPPLETIALSAGAVIRDGESITFSVEAWGKFRKALGWNDPTEATSG